MDFTQLNKNDLLSLFNYVGKKFDNWEELDTNWGLDITEPINFALGTLYAKEYDQAGTNFWFYDGVISYGMYVWCLLDGACSVISIKIGKYLSKSDNFLLEKKPNEFPQQSSLCTELFAPILNLNMTDFKTEADLVKEASHLLEGFAFLFGSKEHEYFFALEDGFFPSSIAGKCMITFVVWQDKIDGICLVLMDESDSKAIKVWKEKRGNQQHTK